MTAEQWYDERFEHCAAYPALMRDPDGWKIVKLCAPEMARRIKADPSVRTTIMKKARQCG